MIATNAFINLNFPSLPDIDMATSSELKILEKCRFWLDKFGLNGRYMSAYGSIRIPNRLIYLIYSIPMTISVMLSAWHIVDNDFDLTASSVAIIIIFGGGQVQVIYLILAAEKDSLFSMIDQLQTLVNKREIFSCSF